MEVSCLGGRRPLLLFPLSLCSDFSSPLEFSAGAGPPSAPSPPTLTHASPHSLTLHWCPPQDNGLPISSYRLDMDDPTTVSLV